MACCRRSSFPQKARLLTAHHSPSYRNRRVRVVSAAEEQHWNAERLTRRICEPEYRDWMYFDLAVVLGSAQRLPPVRSGVALPVFKRDAGGGAVGVGPWLVSASVALPSTHD